MQTRRILIVANQTAPGSHLKDIVRQRMDDSECTFVLLVPATPPRGNWTWTDAEAVEVGRHQMEVALEGLQGLGATIEGRVEEGSPMDAVAAYMQAEGSEHHQPFDEIILSTLPPGVSRWLKQDLAHRLSSRYGIPVTHVVGESTSTPTS